MKPLDEAIALRKDGKAEEALSKLQALVQTQLRFYADKLHQVWK